MAYTNFIPELWAEKVQRENEKMLVMAKLCNREWEGELKKKAIPYTFWGSDRRRLAIMTEPRLLARKR